METASLNAGSFPSQGEHPEHDVLPAVGVRDDVAVAELADPLAGGLPGVEHAHLGCM